MATHSRRQITRQVMSLFIAVSAALFVILVSLPRNSILNVFESRIYDLWLILRGDLPERQDIVIMGITSDDLELIGQWPWSKQDLAYLLDKIRRYEPAVIVFDIVFSEHEGGWDKDQKMLDALSDEEKAQMPDIVQAKKGIIDLNREAEREFVRIVREAGNIYLAGYLDVPPQPSETAPFTTVQPLLQQLPAFTDANFLFAPSLTEEKRNQIKFTIPEGHRPVLPIAQLSQAAAGIGFINVEPDHDGIIRRTQLLARMGNRVLPSLDLLVISDFLDVPLEQFEILPGEEIRFIKEGQLYRIPITPEGHMFINFKGPQAYIHSGVSVTGFTLAAEGHEAPYSPEIVKGKIVLIGMLAEGSTDIRPVPVDRNYPLVGVHAQVLDNILSRSPVRVMPSWLSGLLLILIAVGMGLILPRVRIFWGASLAILILVGVPAAAYSAFVLKSYWIPSFQPALSVALGYSGTVFYYFVVEQVQRRHIQEVFGRCVDRTVVDQIVDSGLDPQLGGTRTALTVMFADISNFTPYSEKHNAEEVVAKLNEYFTAMTEVIFRSRGTVDKYMGDAIMVFYGNPVPMEDHALQAVKTAVEMQVLMNDLQIKWGSEGFSQSVGIHTGEAVVGWMGSPSRKEYTVIGDTVNTAFRIEGVAKSGQVLISQSTYDVVKAHVEAEPLEPIALKGKSAPQQLYSVIGFKRNKG